MKAWTRAIDRQYQEIWFSVSRRESVLDELSRDEETSLSEPAPPSDSAS